MTVNQKGTLCNGHSGGGGQSSDTQVRGITFAIHEFPEGNHRVEIERKAMGRVLRPMLRGHLIWGLMDKKGPAMEGVQGLPSRQWE